MVTLKNKTETFHWSGFKDCSSALKESKGDLEKAEILRVKGIAKASKKCQETQKKE